jgi:hypothetical protein
MKSFLFEFALTAIIAVWSGVSFVQDSLTSVQFATDMRKAQVDSICELYKGDTADVTVHDFQRMCGLAGYKGTK